MASKKSTPAQNAPVTFAALAAKQANDTKKPRKGNGGKSTRTPRTGFTDETTAQAEAAFGAIVAPAILFEPSKTDGGAWVVTATAGNGESVVCRSHADVAAAQGKIERTAQRRAAALSSKTAATIEDAIRALGMDAEKDTVAELVRAIRDNVKEA